MLVPSAQGAKETTVSRRNLRVAVCAAAVLSPSLAATHSARGDFTGISGEPWIATIEGNVFFVMDVFVESTLPTDRVLTVFNTSVLLQAKPGALFHHESVPGGAMTTLPVCYIDQSPYWLVDTFVSLGGEQCSTAGTAAFTPDTSPAFLVTSASTSGPQGWYIVPPISPNNETGPDHRIRIARFAIRGEDWTPGAKVSASWTLGWAPGYGMGVQFTSVAGTFVYPQTAADEPSFDEPGAGLPVIPIAPPLPAGSIATAQATWVAPGGWITGFTASGLSIIDAKTVVPKIPMSWMPLGKGDLDADGDDDFAFLSLQTGVVAGILMQNGLTSATAQIATLPDEKWSLIGFGDVGGDGRADFVWRDSDGGFGQVRVWTMNGLVRTENVEISISPGFEPIGFGDFDNDGRHDILWRWLLTNMILGWKLNGTAPPTIRWFGGTSPIQPHWTVATTADLDADGDDDVLWRNTNNGNVNAWIVQDFARITGGLVAPSVSGMWRVATVVDLDDDGDEDVVWQRQTDGLVNGWIMQGPVRTSGGTLFGANPDWMPIR
jgi:hypothetical protein